MHESQRTPSVAHPYPHRLAGGIIVAPVRSPEGALRDPLHRESGLAQRLDRLPLAQHDVGRPQTALGIQARSDRTVSSLST